MRRASTFSASVMFDAQTWYARDVILGRIKLPSKEAMQKDDDAWVKREEALKDAFEKIDFQADYVRELCDATDYPKFDIDMSVLRPATSTLTLASFGDALGHRPL